MSVERIFLNYSRTDAYAAALLDRHLSDILGENLVFRASRSIIAGKDYEDAILEAIGRCEVMLAIVGPEWDLSSTEAPNTRSAWAYREIAEALVRKLPVVPVLLTGASRLDEASLGAEISALAKAQYLRFEYRNLTQDAARIVSELRRLCPSLEKDRNRADHLPRSLDRLKHAFTHSRWHDDGPGRRRTK